MNFESLIIDFGYPAVFIGTFLEGEGILMIAGLLAQKGYLDLLPVFLLALVASFMGDQILFFLGRYNAEKVLSKYLKHAPKIEKAHQMIHKYESTIIFLMRFIYGFRYIIPVSLGMSKISTRKFVVLNFLSAVVWALAISLLGYFLGHTLVFILEDLNMVVLAVISVLALGGVLFTGYRYLYRSKAKLTIE